MPIAQIFKDDYAAPVKIWTNDVEETAMKQLHDVSKLPFIHSHVAVMPDAHWGNGTTVGCVLPTIKAIVPAAVGVDLGCGMMAVKLNITEGQLPDSLATLRSNIERAVPHGRTNNGGPGDRGAWGEAPPSVYDAWGSLRMDPRIVAVRERHPKLFGRGVNDINHLGTLGTGNHFIELCVDTAGSVWIMLHSGSRGIGNRIGTYFIEKAKEEMVRWHVDLPDPQLAFLPEDSQYFEDYWKALSWAQDYAAMNRELMMDAALDQVRRFFGFPVNTVETAVNCHHNYVAIENHFGKNVYVTRKGAVRARVGDLGIIPGSMGALSFIVRGKGNADSFCSCSHGAGRRMSRGEAKKRFGLVDLAEQTAGVECRKDADVIDEIPAAYKDIRTVMDNQSDLVEVVAELRQVLCVKG
ncbi:MAG: RtcB family protein [Proteobacteria bacterium]|nr:RtcB family protein [Pseudomonadota bacterium]